MFKIINKSNWLISGLIFFMPILLIFFLGSQMAYSQVWGKFEAYQTIPAVTQLAELAKLPAGQVVLLRGRISAATPLPAGANPDALLVYQERPASDRETRYQEEFPLIFSELVLDLPDGQLAISPSLSRERVIQGELHSERVGDRTYTGFRSGDTVTVQGEWQPAAAGSPSVLQDVTGISSADRATLLAEWQTAFQKVSWARNSLGLLTLLGLVLLVVEWWRNKLGQRMSNELTDAPRAALESVR